MKMNKTKKIVTLTAAMALTLACGAAFMGNTETNALVFDMRGASIRYQESENVKDNGIRFGVYTDATTYANFTADTNAVVGTLILPTDMLDGDLTIDNADAINAITNGTDVTAEENVTVSAWAEAEEGYMESIVYLTDIPKASYNRSLTARGYIDWNGDGTNVQYTTDSVSIAIADVALSVMDLPETTEDQKTELQSYINNYTVKFTDDYDRTTKETVAYGSEFTTTPATLENRTGFNFLGWYEKNVDGTYADVATDFETVDKTVKSHREFVAKYEETGKTFSKPGITGLVPLVAGASGQHSYQNGNYVITNTGWKFTNTNGIIASTTPFVVSATLQPSDAERVGFVIQGTADKYIVFGYRKSAHDIYVEGSGLWLDYFKVDAGIKVYGEDGQQPAKFDLIYEAGHYYFFINGVLARDIPQTSKNSWGGDDIATRLGTGMNLSVGLASLGGGYTTTFTDWSYSTDADVIAASFPPVKTEKPALGQWLVASANTSLVDGTLTMTNAGKAFALDRAYKTGEAFVISATFNPVANAQIGFVFSAQTNYYLQFVYRLNQNDVYLWSDAKANGGLNKWLSKPVSGVDVFGENNDQPVTMTLVYSEGMYYIFFDGVLGCQVSENQDDGGWGNTAKTAIGSGATLNLGLVVRDCGEVTFTDWWCSNVPADVATWLAKLN